MVRHEAVRNYGEQVFCRPTRNLRQHQTHGRVVREEILSLMRAKRQRISMKADVVERREMTWRSGEHARHRASGIPTVRLKPDTTDTLKPETTEDVRPCIR